MLCFGYVRVQFFEQNNFVIVQLLSAAEADKFRASTVLYLQHFYLKSQNPDWGYIRTGVAMGDEETSAKTGRRGTSFKQSKRAKTNNSGHAIPPAVYSEMQQHLTLLESRIALHITIPISAYVAQNKYFTKASALVLETEPHAPPQSMHTDLKQSTFGKDAALIPSVCTPLSILTSLDSRVFHFLDAHGYIRHINLQAGEAICFSSKLLHAGAAGVTGKTGIAVHLEYNTPFFHFTPAFNAYSLNFTNKFSSQGVCMPCLQDKNVIERAHANARCSKCRINNTPRKYTCNRCSNARKHTLRDEALCSPHYHLVRKIK